MQLLKVNNIFSSTKQFLLKPVSIAPLISFRILFGLMLFISTLRFISKGWINSLYIQPKFHFPYEGFEFIKPFSMAGMNVLFIIMLLSSICIALGLFYRFSAIVFFLIFTYIELIDKTNYLNHYYFVSIICLMLCVLPANKYAALDVKFGFTKWNTHIPNWCIFVLQLQIGLVYFFAGIAKLNTDWLIHAQPLSIWLKSRDYYPIIGFIFDYKITPFLFSWFGMLFDLTIVFFLWNKKTRPFAYIAVVVFHTITGFMFQIGVFPMVMIVATWIFFSEGFHKKFIALFYKQEQREDSIYVPEKTWILKILFLTHFAIQFFLPFRYLLYPGHLFWTEQGYRFSWRVMLMEKNAYTTFVVKDKTGKIAEVNNRTYLTPQQEKMMSTQPDMILQFGHFLKKEYEQKYGYIKAEVYADSYASVNGRPSKQFIDNSINLADQPINFAPKKWILPYNDENKK